MKKSRIMLVDDDQVMLLAMTEALKEADYEVHSYSSAQAGLDAASRHLNETGAPAMDLVISDINMPEMSGFDLCKQLNGQKAYQHLPVMLVSGQTDDETVVEGYKAGCFDFIPKPLVLDKFLIKCDNALKQALLLKKFESKAKKAKAVASEAMESGSRVASILAFAESGSLLDTHERLAQKIFETLMEYGYQASILFDFPDLEQPFFSSLGYENPLERKMLEQLRSSNAVFNNTHYYEFKGRLFASFEKSIVLVRNAKAFGDESLKDYMGTLMNCVDTRTRLIEQEIHRQGARKLEQREVMTKLEESTVDLKGMFKSQMKSLNTIIELMASELDVRFSSLDIGERNEAMIQGMVGDALLQLEDRIEQGSEMFDHSVNDLTHEMNRVILKN